MRGAPHVTSSGLSAWRAGRSPKWRPRSTLRVAWDTSALRTSPQWRPAVTNSEESCEDCASRSNETSRNDDSRTPISHLPSPAASPMTQEPSHPATTPSEAAASDENRLIAERREKLKALRAQGIAFPNDFKVDSFAGDLQAEFADKDTWTAEAIEAAPRRVAVAGRIILMRGQGKVSFVQMQDGTGRIQLFVHQGTVGED